MDVIKAIKTKRAVRLFTNDPVPDDVITAILEAGQQSQSSKNTQPWHFVVVKDREKLTALSKTGDFAGHLAGATFAIVLVSPSDRFWVGFDLGQVAANLQLAAWEHGVGSCIAAIFHPDDAKSILNIPAEMTSHVALSFGYPSPHHQVAQMGGRKPLDDIVHWDSWH